jgi:3',5'-cyclic AMP phosphodiesterase CpdA
MIDIGLSIAVISDIHVGPHARSDDLTPGTSDALRKERFLERFGEHVKNHDLKADYLIVSGDITSRAEAAEFKHASDVVLNVAGHLGVDEDRIFFVPGNHDVDWSVLAAATNAEQQEFRWTQRYAPITAQPTMFSRRGSGATGSLFQEPYAAVWSTGDLLVAGVNSAWHDCPTAVTHNGKAAQASLDWLDKELSKHARGDAGLRVFVVHHHPIQYSAPYPDTDDFSIMTNAENLLGLLRTHKFDVLVHGHKHVPRFSTQLVQSDYPLHVLGAGSFCAELGSVYSGSVTNQFHLIHVHGRLGPGSRVVGFLESWAFLGPNGWLESSHRHNGIHDRMGFGYYLSSVDVEHEVFTIAQAKLGEKDYLRWSDLAKEVPGLSYVPPTTVRDVLLTVSTKLKAELVGSSIHDFMLIKGS